MEPNGVDPPQVEVLDTGRPPGALERWAGTVVQRRGAKVAGLVGLGLVAGGAWLVLSPDEPADAGPEEAAAAVAAPGLRPPPAQGRESGTGTWKVTQDVAIRSGPKGHTITFFAVNRGPSPADPTQFRVAAGFVDRPGLDYQAACQGVQLTPEGYQHRQGTVRPGKGVFVRCTDTTRYGAGVAWIDPKTVVVSAEVCEESRGMPGV